MCDYDATFILLLLFGNNKKEKRRKFGVREEKSDEKRVRKLK